MPARIKILFVAANPFVIHPISLDREMRDIRSMLVGPLGDSVDLVFEWTGRAMDLQEQLLRHRPQVLHFSGHGAGSTEIMFEDASGTGTPIGPGSLRKLLELFKDDLRVVVLDEIDSPRQEEAIAKVIDFTVSISSEVPEQAAAAFCAFFYQGLASGRSVQEAFDLGANSILLEGTAEYIAPTLLVRRGVHAFTLIGTISGEKSSPSGHWRALPPDRSIMNQPPEPWPNKTKDFDA
jgi:hypothetical protein